MTTTRDIIISRLLVINAGHFAAVVQVIKSRYSMNYIMNQEDGAEDGQTDKWKKSRARNYFAEKLLES